MKIVYEYSHLGGSEILQVHYPDWNQEIYQVISEVDAHRPSASEPKTLRERPFYSSEEIMRRFKDAFSARGYRELRDTYTITIPDSDTLITDAYKQIDLAKDQVLIEVQFNKHAFMFYAMTKFQHFFSKNKADVGVEIVPCCNLKRRMSSGASFGEQLIHEIQWLKGYFPIVPIKVILIDADD